MHNNNLIKTLKATILNVIVALFITGIMMGAIYLLANKQIEKGISLISKVSIDIENKEPAQEAKLVEEDKRITNYPEYGTQYATIQIPNIDVDLPVYYGDTLDIIKGARVGHTGGSYFPGEGGSIIYMGHNSTKVFRRFSELKKGNEITVKTSYGEFKYKIYDMQIVQENETDKLPIQKDKEILMIYTCYPFVYVGYTTQRYVVYAELVY